MSEAGSADTDARRSDTQGKATDDIKEGYQYYRSTVQESDDPLLKTVRTVGDSIGKATEGLRDALKDILKNK